jgi:hypothetical protein
MRVPTIVADDNGPDRSVAERGRTYRPITPMRCNQVRIATTQKCFAKAAHFILGVALNGTIQLRQDLGTSRGRSEYLGGINPSNCSAAPKSEPRREYGWNPDKTKFSETRISCLLDAFIRVSSVFHPWLLFPAAERQPRMEHG